MRDYTESSALFGLFWLLLGFVWAAAIGGAIGLALAVALPPSVGSTTILPILGAGAAIGVVFKRMVR